MRELRGISPLFWLANTVVAFVLAAAVWMYGAFSGGLGTVYTCATRGQAWDTEYSRQNRGESGRFFPLHTKCNADYDLVPFWVNPALVSLTLLVLAFATTYFLSLSSWQNRQTRKPRV